MSKASNVKKPAAVAGAAPCSAKRDGNWMDEWGACKICDGEIPHGHTDNCDIYKLECEVRRLQSALEGWVKYFQADVPMTAEAAESQGGEFTHCWFETEKALSPNDQAHPTAAKATVVRRCICATVRRKRKWYPKRIIFDTQLQEDAERCMAELGYGCDQYWLSWVDVTTPNEKPTP